MTQADAQAAAILAYVRIIPAIGNVFRKRHSPEPKKDPQSEKYALWVPAEVSPHADKLTPYIRRDMCEKSQNCRNTPTRTRHLLSGVGDRRRQRYPSGGTIPQAAVRCSDGYHIYCILGKSPERADNRPTASRLSAFLQHAARLAR